MHFDKFSNGSLRECCGHVQRTHMCYMLWKCSTGETRKIIEECQEKLKNGEDVEDGILRQLVEATDEDGKLLSMECMQVSEESF